MPKVVIHITITVATLGLWEVTMYMKTFILRRPSVVKMLLLRLLQKQMWPTCPVKYQCKAMIHTRQHALSLSIYGHRDYSYRKTAIGIFYSPRKTFSWDYNFIVYSRLVIPIRCEINHRLYRSAFHYRNNVVMKGSTLLKAMLHLIQCSNWHYSTSTLLHPLHQTKLPWVSRIFRMLLLRELEPGWTIIMNY